MNNRLSYVCGLVDARIRASEKNLPVPSFLPIPIFGPILLLNSFLENFPSILSYLRKFETLARVLLEKKLKRKKRPKSVCYWQKNDKKNKITYSSSANWSHIHSLKLKNKTNK